MQVKMPVFLLGEVHIAVDALRFKSHLVYFISMD